MVIKKIKKDVLMKCIRLLWDTIKVKWNVFNVCDVVFLGMVGYWIDLELIVI